MKASIYISLAFAVLAIAAFAGCGGEPKPAPLAPPTALTLEEWKAMTDIPDKYDGATLDRLRMGNPKLQSERAWDAYIKQVIVPERKKDIPGSPG